MIEKDLNDENFRRKLTNEAYSVCRLGATEAPFSGKYYLHNEKGKYLCIACGTELFSSESKFNSGTGWPSFDQSYSEQNIKLLEDRSFGMTRTEIRCAKCDSHLGHVFPDGHTKTGLRYCVNSVALDFKKE